MDVRLVSLRNTPAVALAPALFLTDPMRGRLVTVATSPGGCISLLACCSNGVWASWVHEWPSCQAREACRVREDKSPVRGVPGGAGRHSGYSSFGSGWLRGHGRRGAERVRERACHEASTRLRPATWHPWRARRPAAKEKTRLLILLGQPPFFIHPLPQATSLPQPTQPTATPFYS